MTPITKHQLFLLLEKQKLGTCTKAEEEMLSQWFDDGPQIESLTFISDEEKEKIRVEMETAIKEQISPATRNVKLARTRKLWLTGMAAATIAGIFAVCLYYLLQGANPEIVVITAPHGIKNMPITLPDSSLVSLTEGSSISYPEKFEADARKVTLQGLAYFSVRHDKTAPFTVNTPEAISVTVLGTSFVVDVRKETKHVDIGVITGLVQVNESKVKLDVVKPGEKLSYSCVDKTFSKKEFLPLETAEWDNMGTVYLNKVSLQEISVLLHTMYHVNLKFDPEKVGHYRFSMSFSKNLSLDEVLKMLDMVSSLKFVANGKEINVNN